MAQTPPSILSKERVAVFLIQPPKYASLEPSRVLGAELQRRGKQHVVKLFAGALR
jgi:UDP:flavonoid glycosyltransferase YjiC (YdhE family)